MANECIFCRIASGELPSEKLHEGNGVFVIADINPQSPVHLLVIPLAHVDSMAEIHADNAFLMENMSLMAKLAAEAAGVAESGYRLVVNTGKNGGQSISHLHMHLLAGRHLSGEMG